MHVFVFYLISEKFAANYDDLMRVKNSHTWNSSCRKHVQVYGYKLPESFELLIIVALDRVRELQIRIVSTEDVQSVVETAA